MSGRRASLAAVALVAAGLVAAPASAHSLKLFVTVDGTTLSGRGFFVGGGRPQGVAVEIRDAGGRTVYGGRTDAQGGFAWTAPGPAAYTVAIDTGDGHFAQATVAADRFLGGPASAPTPMPGGDPLAAAGPDGRTGLAAAVEASIDRALARRLTPLVEAQERSEARLRFADVMGGIGMIVGLGGLAAWGFGRRRTRGGDGA